MSQSIVAIPLSVPLLLQGLYTSIANSRTSRLNSQFPRTLWSIQIQSKDRKPNWNKKSLKYFKHILVIFFSRIWKKNPIFRLSRMCTNHAFSYTKWNLLLFTVLDTLTTICDTVVCCLQFSLIFTVIFNIRFIYLIYDIYIHCNV